MIKYVKGDLFDQPMNKNTFLAHATNCQGKWGSGIAVGFAKNYPLSYKEYSEYCEDNAEVLGTTFITSENIICLHTSKFYGKWKDSPPKIIKSTELAIKHLFDHFVPNEEYNIYSNKFNSGLFHTPWEWTEKVILNELKNWPDLNVNWTVVEYD